MKIKAAGNSHTGLKRMKNEDSFILNSGLGLYVIADGMGGHKAGEVASRMVVESMEGYWKKFTEGKPIHFLRPVERAMSEKAGHLINSIALANILVYEAQKKPEYSNMGSTVCAVLKDNDTLWVANVGDSPVYLHKPGHMELISEEHSVLAEQKSRGLYESFGSGEPMMKNMLTRAIGLNDTVDVFLTRLQPEHDHTVLLCSDGLTNYLSIGAIGAVLDDFSMSLENKVNVLIDEANKGGGGDNITVILLRILDHGKWTGFKNRFKKGD